MARKRDRRLRSSLTVSSLFNKLSNYDSSIDENIHNRNYERVSKLTSTSQDVVDKISDEIIKEFNKICPPQK